MIRVTYQKGGDVRLEPSGYPGQVCREATQPYENRSGQRDSREVESTAVEITQTQQEVQQ